MKLHLFFTSVFLTVISGCSSQPELLCGGDNVKELADQLLKNTLLGRNEKIQNEPEPSWEYIFPSYKIDIKNIRLTNRNKETNQISCEADVESNIFDIRKLAIDMINSLKNLMGYLEKKEPNNKESAEGLYMLSTQLKVIAINNENFGNTYAIKYEVQPTEDKKSIHLKFTSSIPKNLVETLNSLSQISYGLRVSEGAIKKEPLSQIAQNNPTTNTQETAPYLPSSSPQMNTEINQKLIPSLPSSAAQINVLPPISSASEIHTASSANTSVGISNTNEVTTILWSPSFDCTKVSTGQERLICNNKLLSELDVKLSLVYRKTLDKSTDKEALRTSQRNWRKFQRDSCVDIECIDKSYTARIAEVEAIK